MVPLVDKPAGLAERAGVMGVNDRAYAQLRHGLIVACVIAAVVGLFLGRTFLVLGAVVGIVVMVGKLGWGTSRP